MPGDFGKALGCLPLLGQTVHHAARAENVAVDRRHCRRDHHDIEDGGRRADAQAVKNLHKGAALAADLGPRVNGHQHKQGQHVKQQNAQRHRVDRLGDHTLRILGFAGGDADDFNTAKGKHHHGKRGNQTAHAIGHKAAEGPKITDAGRHRIGAARGADAKQHDAETGQDHRDDGGDLEQ